NQPEIRLGSLHPTRDLTYVADTCEGFVKAAESDAAVGETIQLGTGRDVSVGYLVETVQKILGKNLPVVTKDERIRPEASEIDRLLSSPEKAKRLLGWEPLHTLEQGLEAHVDWMRQHLDRYRTDAYLV
ncbi:MAG TPA: GDP-mannose 4,6-dehydratase, partial [Chthoniobacteraceae bacterium]|nr:GDP-mannose 4,6-dehydratase [Chthoniobacteraceae bacterium]